MEDPTLVFLTDRNDLDDQLFRQFQRCHEILRQTPVQADSVEHLRKLLNVASSGLVFHNLLEVHAGGEMREAQDRYDRQRSNDLTVRPTSKLTPARRPSPSLGLLRRFHQFAAAVGPRLHRQSSGCAQQAPFSPSTERTKVLVSRAAKTNGVIGHCASDGVSLQRAG